MFEGDEQLLRELATNCRDAKEKVRYFALHALCKGCTVPLVSEIFCVEESTIYRWIERWKTQKCMQDKPKSGRPPVLDNSDKKEIKKLLEDNDPKKYGINASFWDTKELQAYFQKQGKRISRETFRACLKGLGARYVKSVIIFPEADTEKQKEFAKKFFEENKSCSAIILFQDEMSAWCSARKGYGWTLGKRLEVKAPQRNRQRLNCFGAVCPKNGEIIQMASKESKTPAFIRFLNKIARKYHNKKIILYLDNLPVHKARKVREFIERHPNIRLEFMPPYSPDLNPQEQWWNYERRKLLNNRNFRSAHQLATSMSWFTRQTTPEQVMSVCSLAPLENVLQ